MVCMIDNDGRTVAEWLPHMQSSDFLRASISKGERTAECWAELSKRTTRVRAALDILNDNRLQSASSQPAHAPPVPAGPVGHPAAFGPYPIPGQGAHTPA